MGLTNTTQQFQATIADRKYAVKTFLIAYIDDIIVSTHAEEGED